MTETIYDMSKRMCDCTNCKDCPVKKVTKQACLIGLIRCFEMEKAAEQLEVLYEWAKEHPVKTYKDVFLEKLPNARLDKDGRPVSCRNEVFGIVKCCTADCKDCWNEPYKE